MVGWGYLGRSGGGGGSRVRRSCLEKWAGLRTTFSPSSRLEVRLDGKMGDTWGKSRGS